MQPPGFCRQVEDREREAQRGGAERVDGRDRLRKVPTLPCIESAFASPTVSPGWLKLLPRGEKLKEKSEAKLYGALPPAPLPCLHGPLASNALQEPITVF